MPIGSLITGLGSIGAGIANTVMQGQNLEYQKQLQNQIFQREDSAVQRRVNDLQRAGLSPVLAAGQAAQSGPVVSTQAPQVSDVGLAMLTAMKGKADISRTEAEAELIHQQAVNAKTQNLIDLQDFRRLGQLPGALSRYGSSDTQFIVRALADIIGGKSGATDAIKNVDAKATKIINTTKKGWNTYSEFMESLPGKAKKTPLSLEWFLNKGKTQFDKFRSHGGTK